MPRPPKASKDKIQQQPIPVPTVMPAANAAVAPRNVEVENFMRVRDSVSFDDFLCCFLCASFRRAPSPCCAHCASSRVATEHEEDSAGSSV